MKAAKEKKSGERPGRRFEASMMLVMLAVMLNVGGGAVDVPPVEVCAQVTVA